MKYCFQTFIKIIITFVIFSTSNNTILALHQFEIEQFYTQLSQKTLDTMFGKHIYITKATVQLSNSEYNVRYTKESKIQKSKNSKEDKKVYLMPGYSALKNISPEHLKELPYDSVTTLTQPKIQKITITVFVNKKVSRAESRKIKPILTELLNLNSKRDNIDLKYKTFVDSNSQLTQQVKIIDTYDPLLSVKNLLLFALTIISFLFLLVYFFKTSKSKGNLPSPSINVQPNIDINKKDTPSVIASPNATSANIHGFFSFITHDNIEILSKLLKKEKASIDYISIIASYISPELLAELLSHFDLNTQLNILEKLQNEQNINSALLKKIEQKTKTSIETTIGGLNIIYKSINYLSPEKQKKLLLHAKSQSPSMYKTLRKNIKLIEDIMHLTEQQLTILISNNNIEDLSKSLCNENEEIIEKIRFLLPEHGKTMLDNYINNYEFSLTKKEKSQAKEQIILQIKKLTQLQDNHKE